jgi:hypothetical protein
MREEEKRSPVIDNRNQRTDLQSSKKKPKKYALTRTLDMSLAAF